MFCNYLFCFGTFFIISSTNYIQKATQNPHSNTDLYNAGTELYLSDNSSDAEFFFKLIISNNPDDIVKEKSLLNYANTLIKQERFQDALDISKSLRSDFKNKQAEHNIPILEEILRQKESEGNQQNQDDQQDNKNNKDQDKQDQQDHDKEQDQQKDNKSQDDNQQNKKSDNNDQKQNEQNSLNEQKNKLKTDKSGKENRTQPGNKLEQLLESISNFDQEMMRLYAQSECNKNDGKGSLDEGW